MATPYIFKNDYKKEINKICIFCTYLLTKNVPDYIVHYIKSLDEEGYKTILVSHSNIAKKDLEKLSKFCCSIIVKENVGYDFFAWKYGMGLITDFNNLEALLLVNDSIIGPFEGLTEIFSTMTRKYDFWGLTENYEFKYHIQSYFLHASKKVLSSDNWINFWNGLMLYDHKLDIVRNYEVELTQALLQNKNIKIGAWVSQKELTSKYPATQYINYPRTNYWNGIANPTVKNWKELLTEFNFPFIKKNLFLGKEHYHFSYQEEVLEYRVAPVNWKNIIEKKYGPQSVSLIQNYVDDFFNDTRRKSSTINLKYKVLFISDSIKTSPQIDYLARLLQFYNKRNIETELIVNIVPSLRGVLETKLQDITKIDILSEITRKDQETLKHRLSQENIGTIIINDTSSAKLAQFFSFTNAPHILITNDPEPQHSIANSEYNFSFHSPFTVSPIINNCKPTTQIALDPIDFSLKPIKSNGQNYSKVPVISFIGLCDFQHQKGQIASFIQTIREKGYTFSFKILFNEDEYHELKKLYQTDKKIFSFFQDDLNCSFVQYNSLIDYFASDEREVIISYFDDLYLPDEYLHCFFGGRVVFMQKNNLYKALFGDSDKFHFDFFKVEKLAHKVIELLDTRDQYKLLLKEQNAGICDYLQNLQSNNYEELLLKEVVDFTELRTKGPIITVIFHFHFYSFDEVSFINYKKRLRAFFKSNVNFLFSITEDSYDIEKQIASLKNAFPNCTIKIVPNKGRDIGAKFLLFDYFIKSQQPSEYIVVLHDKKSLHLPFWEAKLWVDSLLKIIDPSYYNSILQIFQNNHGVGIIGSSERIVDCIIKWEEENGIKTPVFEWNNDLLNSMIKKFNINISDYNFVGGTMFWIKTELLHILNTKYKFIRQYIALEEGNVMDNEASTITHCWERLICWLATNNGYKVGKI